jgi:hypothetical protein
MRLPVESVVKLEANGMTRILVLRIPNPLRLDINMSGRSTSLYWI